MITPLPQSGQGLPIHSSVSTEGTGTVFPPSAFLRDTRFLTALGVETEAEERDAETENFVVVEDGCTETYRLLQSANTLATMADTICFSSSRNWAALYVRRSISRNFFFLLPNTGQFSTLQQFFIDNLYQLHTCRGGYQTFSVLTDVVALE